jgi:two-component system OmpR family sensor kinase
LGRLFWKIIFAFWLAFAAISLTIGAALWVIHETHTESFFSEGPSGGPAHNSKNFMLDTAIAVLTNGSTDSLRATLAVWQHDAPPFVPVMYVLDEQGLDLLKRPVPSLAEVRVEHMVRTVRGADGHVYSLFMSRPPPGLLPADGGMPPPGGHGMPPSPWVLIISALFVSLGFSGWLAWYLAKPIRLLRWAFRAAAEGKLHTRVQPLMGRRRDEIADLVRDFDRMAHQLQKQMGAQQRLLHDVSHELRSPLARLQAAIGLARMNPRRIDMTLARIEHESARLDALVTEVLTLARLETGVCGAALEQVDLVELLTQIVDDAQFEAQAQQRDVLLDGEGEFVMECRAELLYRSFENVIRNAVKYTYEQTTVQVSVQVTPMLLTVTVADQGPGVPVSALEHIFDPFYRADDNRATQGFGLGLAIARRAVESHGGTIRAELGAKGGLVVQIQIPRPERQGLLPGESSLV